MKRDIQFLRTIEAPYREVRRRLRDDAAALLGDGGEPIRSSLVTRILNTEIAREVEIEIVAFDEPEGDASGANLMFRADALRHSDLFPHLDARLEALPVAHGQTALFLTATYKPPLGVVGGAVNTLGLHRIARQSLRALFDTIAERLTG
ncbi:MAG: hypothetical protein MUP76_10765 [Acidimicrobiia bacterium]|nr:hypothetical protein [Acidimicrobiia bacterium]